MSIAGVPISLWQQLSSFADVSFVGAGGQAPIITAKPECKRHTKIDPFEIETANIFTHIPFIPVSSLFSAFGSKV